MTGLGHLMTKSDKGAQRPVLHAGIQYIAIRRKDLAGSLGDHSTQTTVTLPNRRSSYSIAHLRAGGLTAAQSRLKHQLGG